ncbi:hypothetical protein EKE94_05840 [Mesobaculum littorinae]|uniref:Alpha/beta hydrolase fold-3 domain-containing protein n=1 Tax=Mesobaculum littorinae TaxID=2486419 RepID=A0A438AI75_9RHOB|nr:alpha/beta hydrolase fold domain-containing protein [Mesobaculum littorinae]RVV98441.1 hypothetical protein EKE94_05840 [Mesobaculum littorinae]
MTQDTTPPPAAQSTAQPTAGPELPRSPDAVRRRIADHPVTGTPAEMRQGFADRIGPQPAARPALIGQVEALVVGDGPDCLFFHGGGYVFGAPETHVAAAQVMAEAGLRVILPRYPLAPEDPWPAQPEAALALLEALPGPVAVAGISAGGHLALTLGLAVPERIAALGLISANTDRSGLSASRAPMSEEDAMNSDADDAALARLVFGDRPGGDPAVSPLLEDLSELPPLKLAAGGAEVLLDDTLLLAHRAALQGASVSLDIAPGQFHMAHMWPEAFPVARAQLLRLARGLRAELDRARADEAGRSGAGG